MKRIVSAALVAVVALSVTGCSRPSANPAKAGSSRPATSTAQAPRTAGPKTWKAMPLGAQETKRLSTLPNSFGLYKTMEKKAGRTPVKLDPEDARFVGYQVQIYAAQPDGAFQSAYIDVLDGRIDAVGETQRPLEAKMVGLIKDQPTRYSSRVLPVSAGEKAAIAKAIAWANGAFPGLKWNAELAGYVFYFDLKGDDYLLYTANASSDGYRVLTGPAGPSGK